MRYRTIEFDKLKQYFGEPYTVDLDSAQGSITIYAPTVGNIIQLGEKEFYQTLNIFTTNTTANRLMLWELPQRIDWNEFSDFNLFCLLYKNISYNASKLLFGEDIHFDNFELYTKTIQQKKEKQNQQENIDTESSEDEYELVETMILYDKENEIEINEEVYQTISQYLKSIFNIYPEELITSDKFLKNLWIQKDKRAAQREKIKEEKGEKETFSVQTLVSACINHPGFKYNLQQLKDVGIAQFYDSVKRLQIYENTTACLKGMFSGMVDGSKISPDSYNYFKDI